MQVDSEDEGEQDVGKDGVDSEEEEVVNTGGGGQGQQQWHQQGQ